MANNNYYIHNSQYIMIVLLLYYEDRTVKDRGSLGRFRDGISLVFCARADRMRRDNGTARPGLYILPFAPDLLTT